MGNDLAVGFGVANFVLSFYVSFIYILILWSTVLIDEWSVFVLCLYLCDKTANFLSEEVALTGFGIYTEKFLLIQFVPLLVYQNRFHVFEGASILSTGLDLHTLERTPFSNLFNITWF